MAFGGVFRCTVDLQKKYGKYIQLCTVDKHTYNLISSSSHVLCK